jgi:hypothetical protein
MWRRAVGAGVVLMVVCVAVFVGTILWRTLGGDYDKYGRVSIPGSGTVTLPQGEVDIVFEVHFATNGSGGALTVPALRFDLVPPDGVADPSVKEDFGSSVSVNNVGHIRVWRMQVPTAGKYAVTSDGDVGGYIDPQLTFGTGSPVPIWPIIASSALFWVGLALVLIGGAGRRRGFAPARPARVTVPAPGAAAVPYGSPSSIEPSASTPEQEIARLAELQKLTDLHTSGTLSDAEYAAAKGRLGG